MAKFLIDLHCHTKEHSYDGQASALEVIAALQERGFAGVVFTDHAYQWPDEELAELRRAAGVGDDFFLASGQEVRTVLNDVQVGDLLVYGLDTSLPDGTSPLEVFRLVAEAGGFCTAPHPAIPRIGLKERLGDYPVLAAEVWNGRYGPTISAKCRRLVEAQGLVGVGGSDAHRVPEVGGGGTLFPELPRDLSHLRAMIAAGDCEPWHPEIKMTLGQKLQAKWKEWKREKGW